ncbi:MAG: hypothetical protein WBD73_16780 [Candidatus Acidiferrales bacterium]
MNFPHSYRKFQEVRLLHANSALPAPRSKSATRSRSFTSPLPSLKHVRKSKYQNNASVYSLAHRRICQAIERENLRNRRSHTFEFMKTRLAMLDFVLSHLEYDYFEGEAEKVQYFEQHLQIRPQERPGRTYRGANKMPDAIRYFVDKFPIFLDSTVAEKPLVIFSFIDPGFGNLDAFRMHLDAYSSFLQRVPGFAFVFASRTPKLFDRAHRLFQNKTNPPIDKLSEQVIRYFTLRANWEAKRYELLKNSDIEFMNHARQCFASETFESAFKDRKAARLTQKDLVAVLENRARRSQEIEFKNSVARLLLIRPEFGHHRQTALKCSSPSGFPYGFPHLFP